MEPVPNWATLAKALERLELHLELAKRCHNQADKGPRKVRKALDQAKTVRQLRLASGKRDKG